MNGLEDIKVGDMVVQTDGWNGLRLVQVDRITDTLIVCGNTRYRRATGREMGCTGYRVPNIRKPMDDDIAVLRMQRALAKLAHVKTLLRKDNAHIFIEHLKQLESNLS